MENTSLKLNSNIMLKEKYEMNPTAYQPYDLLPAGYSDVRMVNSLSKYQQEQQLKKMFFTKKIVDE